MESSTCGSCATDNAADRKFCRSCGASLSVQCGRCGRANDPGDRFCGDCGSQLTAAPAPSVPSDAPPAPSSAERRLVTVLFADLVGFTSFSEERDAEDVRSMLTDYFEECRSIVARFGGTVDKFIGDAVMAVWGATAAREDDAERAVRAAMELVDAVTSRSEAAGSGNLALRAGVMTGESSVGPGGNAMGLVVGDQVNTASRLQSLAEPGTVLVGDTTYELTHQSIRYRSLGEHTVKGKANAVEAWQAVGIATRMGGAEHSEVIEPPFVGRDNELRLLKDQLGAAGSDRRARLVSVIGEAGIGKSRLAWELKKYADGLVENVYWHQGRSPSYGEGLTFWALGEMVRSRAGIAEDDDDHRSRTKLRTAVVEFCPDPSEQRWIEPRLAGLLGLAEMPSGERSELYSALRTFFQRIAERAPTVMVFEDLHWADDGLIEFVEELVERSTASPLLVLTLTRPELFDRHPGWGSRHRHGAALNLSPLNDTAMTEMVAGMAPDLSDDLVAQVVERAAGIPLYAVEFVRMVQSDPATADSAIPDSLRSLIGARLDRFDAETRSTVQDAAVLGLSFPPSSLAALRDEPTEQVVDRLRDLTRNEVFEIEDDPRSPERGQYRFVQGLIREVAYARLGRAERRQRHIRVAESLELLDEAELAGAIAAHYVAAHEADPGDSSAELLGLARHALLDAARRASALHSHRQALGLCRQAMDTLGESGGDVDLYMLAAYSANSLNEAEAALKFGSRALELAEAGGDRDLIVDATWRLGIIYNDADHWEEAAGLLGPVYEGMEELRTESEVRLAAEYARCHMLRTAFYEMLPVIDRTLPAAEALGMHETIANALITKAAGLGYVGRISEGLALVRGAIRIAETHDLPQVAARASNNLAFEVCAENWNERMEILDRGAEFAERAGDVEFRLRMRFWRADTLRAQGRLDEALEFFEIDAPESSRMWTVLIEFQVLKTKTLMGADGDLDRQRALLDGIQELGGQAVSMAKEERAGVYLHAGDFHEAARWTVSTDHVMPYPVGIEAGLQAAVKLGDPEIMRQMGEKLAHHSRSASAVDVLRGWASAAEAALTGDTDRAVTEFGAALARAERVSSRTTRAAIQASFWGLVGDADPAAREAGLAAARFIDETGYVVGHIIWPELPSTVSDASAAG